MGKKMFKKRLVFVHHYPCTMYRGEVYFPEIFRAQEEPFFELFEQIVFTTPTIRVNYPPKNLSKLAYKHVSLFDSDRVENGGRLIQIIKYILAERAQQSMEGLS